MVWKCEMMGIPQALAGAREGARLVHSLARCGPPATTRQTPLSNADRLALSPRPSSELIVSPFSLAVQFACRFVGFISPLLPDPTTEYSWASRPRLDGPTRHKLCTQKECRVPLPRPPALVASLFGKGRCHHGSGHQQ